MSTLVKICGLSTPESLEAALDAGADLVGFVFFPASPRHVALPQARELGRGLRGGAQKVALSVNATDAELGAQVEALQPDLLQFHGSENPERLRQVKARFGLPIIKAVAVETKADLAAAADYAGVADRILFDARPPKQATRPGGLGMAFDWRLLQGLALDAPLDSAWMLSGGLSADNVAEALRITATKAVDVSSGVETAPGVKDPAMIRAFLRAVRAADAAAPQKLVSC